MTSLIGVNFTVNMQWEAISLNSAFFFKYDKPDSLNRGFTVKCLLINYYYPQLKVRRGLLS